VGVGQVLGVGVTCGDAVKKMANSYVAPFVSVNPLLNADVKFSVFAPPARVAGDEAIGPA